MTYKILNNLVSVDKDYFFTVNTNPTRSNGLKLYKNRFNTTIKGHSFSQRIVNDWNTLPHEIVSAPNVLIFKTKLDVFLYDRRFDLDVPEIGFYKTLSSLYQLINNNNNNNNNGNTLPPAS